MSYREERAAQRVKDILQTAIEIIQEKGYNDMTIEEIASKLKYTKGSIYYYIPKKEHLLFQCHEIAMQMVIKKARPVAESDLPPDQKLRELIRTHVHVLVDEMSLLSVVLQHEFDLEAEHRQKIIEMRNEYEAFYVKVLAEGMAKGVFRNIDLSLAKLAIIGAVNWIPHWYSKSGSLSKKDIADFFTEFQVAPLLRDQQINFNILSPKVRE